MTEHEMIAHQASLDPNSEEAKVGAHYISVYDAIGSGGTVVDYIHRIRAVQGVLTSLVATVAVGDVKFAHDLVDELCADMKDIILKTERGR